MKDNNCPDTVTTDFTLRVLKREVVATFVIDPRIGRPDGMQGAKIIKRFPVSKNKLAHLEQMAIHFKTTTSKYLTARMLLSVQKEVPFETVTISDPQLTALAHRIEAYEARNGETMIVEA